jgi:hypothetical protein
MSAFRLSTMLMKANDLNRSLHDVDEKKGERRGAEIVNSESLRTENRLIHESGHRFIGSFKTNPAISR